MKILAKYRRTLFFSFSTILIITASFTTLMYIKLLGVGTFILLCFLMNKYHKKQIECKTSDFYIETQKQLLKDIFKYCPDLIFVKDKNCVYTACNDAFLKAHGKSCDQDIIGKNNFDILPEDVAKSKTIQDENILRTGEIIKFIEKVDYHEGNGIKFFELIKAPHIYNEEIVGVLTIAREITDKINLQNILFKKQSQLSAILDNLPFITYLKDTTGQPTVGNNKFNSLVTSDVQNQYGLTLKDLSLLDSINSINEEDERIIENKEIISHERKIETSNGDLWFMIHKAPIIDVNKKVNGIVVRIKNITESKESEIQKENFIATLTHDLKTPTCAQIKALDLLNSGAFGELNSKQHEITEQTLNSCKYMFNMISTILSTYKLENEDQKLKPEIIDLKDLIYKSLNEVAYLANEKNQILKTDFHTENGLIEADKLKLTRVIINLLLNALSLASSNSQIDLSLKDKNESIHFEIKSNNSIKKEELEKLFEKYCPSKSKYRQVGTGLGLYLSKQIIKKHNGEIIATNKSKDQIVLGFSIPKHSSFISNHKSINIKR